MPKNILFESGPEGSPGLFLHAWSANVRGGMVHGPTQPSGAAGCDRGGLTRAFKSLAPAEALAVALDPPSGQRNTLDTLAHRRSVRTYADQPFTRTELARLLAVAHPAGQPAGGTSPPHRGIRPWQEVHPAIALVVVALQVDGLRPGAYVYAAKQQTIQLTQEQDLLPIVQDSFFQAEFTLAPAIVLLVGSIAEMIRSYGDRGYRYLLLDTGVMIQRLYLAASCLDFSGSITGSFVQSKFDRWLGLDGYNAGVLMAFAAGRRALDEDRHAD